MHAHAGHDRSHGHHHPLPSRIGMAFGVGIALNVAFVAAEVVYGVRAGSMALIADAGHNLGDVLGLVLAWWASELAKRSPTSRTTYGLGRSTIWAALVNGSLLMAGVGAIVWESVQRLMHPRGVEGSTVMIVAACGVVINSLTALLFFRDREHDLNVRGAFTHMAADALTSLGVVASGALMVWLGWQWLDPVVSLAIAALLVWGTWGLLREATMLAMDAVPAAIDPTLVQAYLMSQPCVEAVHDLHIWAMSTTETALTAHLVMSTVPASDEMLERITRELQERFRIAHTTIQFEHGDGSSPCAQMHHAGGAVGR